MCAELRECLIGGRGNGASLSILYGLDRCILPHLLSFASAAPSRFIFSALSRCLLQGISKKIDV